MKKVDERDNDLEFTIKIPVIRLQDLHIKLKGPSRIVFPFVSKIGITLALILSVTLLIHALYTHFITHSISLIDETVPVFSGKNGSGSTDPSFHPEQNAFKEMEEISDDKDMKKLIDSVTCSFDASEGLTNGMQVTYACSYNIDLADEMDISFKDTSRVYTVEGLEEGEALDPFDNFEITLHDDSAFDLAPDQKYTDLGISYSYTYDDAETITVTIEYDPSSLKKEGYYIPEEDQTKTMKIPQRLSLEEVPQEKLESIKEILLTRSTSELDACHSQITFGKESIETFDPVFDSFIKNDDGTYDAIITLNNIYSLTLPDYYHFTVRYHGSFIKESDGTIKFQTEDTHGCAYDGFGSEYSLQ